MTNQRVITASEMISDWRDWMARRSGQEEFDRETFEARCVHYEIAPSFEQYRALSCYLHAMDLEMVTFSSDEERLKAYRGTFGSLYPEADADELEAVLAGHFRAMAAAYDAEIEAALSDFKL
ncbi:hypothetical protein ACEUZ9_001005 [Paracoccus litorisediminis]|uniref:hypothetical protein n=1 Tax=Paracoccus litorisediminis TaxID=2006130 RepID=UPI003731E18E